eukprot:2024317-Rhodomonas_salina.3
MRTVVPLLNKAMRKSSFAVLLAFVAALVRAQECPPQDLSACTTPAETDRVPCRTECTLLQANAACAAGAGTIALPCGVYQCQDTFGNSRFCNPSRDSPTPHASALGAMEDVLGCDAQNETSWAAEACTDQTEISYSNDTCSWQLDITTWTRVTGQLLCNDGSSMPPAQDVQRLQTCTTTRLP